jgi:microcystin-dependent protein
MLISDTKETYDTTVKNGWLECNGQAVSRTNYSGLFGKIGTTYGAGDGSTTFNVPTEAAATGKIVVIATTNNSQ